MQFHHCFRADRSHPGIGAGDPAIVAKKYLGGHTVCGALADDLSGEILVPGVLTGRDGCDAGGAGSGSAMSNDDGKLAAGRAASASRLGRLLRNIAAAAIENVIDLLAQRLELEDESRIVFFLPS